MIRYFAIFVLALYFYHSLGFNWTTFGIFFLILDISFALYLVRSKVGAIADNFAHSLIGACIVLGLSLGLSGELLQINGLIWIAHIGFDRVLGYGLKYVEGFGSTGNIGKVKNV